MEPSTYRQKNHRWVSFWLTDDRVHWVVCRCLESSGSVRGTQTGRAIVASTGGAEVGAAATAIAAAGHVKQAAGMAVQGGRGVDAARVACQSIYAGNDRGRDARSAKDQPAADIPEGVKDGDAGGRIGNCRNVRDGPASTSRVVLPARLGNEPATAAARAIPGCF